MEVNGIVIDIEYKPIKHIHLSVYPPEGKVHASVPNGMSEPQIRLFILSKYMWLKSKIDEATSHKYQKPREYVSGEAHYYKGQLYRLRVEIRNTGKQEVAIEGDYIAVYCRRQENAEDLLKEWYRLNLKELLPPLIEKWCKRMQIEVPSFEVKSMPKRWGSCSKEKKNILFNLELAKKPIECIDYIVVHEMIHLVERNHTDRFYRLLNTYLPGWEKIKDMLNEYPVIINFLRNSIT